VPVLLRDNLRAEVGLAGVVKPRTHEVERGKGVPKEREVERRQEVCDTLLIRRFVIP
jgi:hypothetical protein